MTLMTNDLNDHNVLIPLSYSKLDYSYMYLLTPHHPHSRLLLLRQTRILIPKLPIWDDFHSEKFGVFEGKRTLCRVLVIQITTKNMQC